jgi:hypothetical protein
LQGRRFQRWLALIFSLSIIILVGGAILYGRHFFSNYAMLLIAAGCILITVFPLEKNHKLLQRIVIFVAVLITLLLPAVYEVYVWTQARYPWNLTEFNAVVVVPRIQCNTFMKNLSFYRLLATLPGDSKNGPGRISVLGGPDNTTSMAGAKTAPNYTDFYNQAMEQSFISDGLIPQSNVQPYWMILENSNSSALGIYGVRFLVCLGAIEPERGDMGWVQRTDLSWPDHSVWENKRYLGRAYILSPNGERRAGVRFLQDSPESVRLEADALEGDKLVLADLFYPGWKVSVNGKSVPSSVYHGCLRSVNLSGGKHIIHWKYSGKIQKAGLVLFLSSLLLLIIFLFNIRRKTYS